MGQPVMVGEQGLFPTVGSDPEFELELLMLAVGDITSRRMHDLSMTRAELARRLEVTPPRVTQLLRGDENLTLRSLARLGWALGLRFELGSDHSSDAIATLVPFWDGAHSAPPDVDDRLDDGMLAEAA